MSLRISRGVALAAVLALAAGSAGCLHPGAEDDPATPQNQDPNARQNGQQGEDPQANEQQPGQYAPQGQQGQQPGPYGQGQPGQQGPYGQPGPQGPYGQPGPNQYGPNGAPPGQYGDPYRPQGYPQQQQPAGPPAGPMPGGMGANDPITVGESQYLRNQASRVIVELINALPAGQKQRVQDVPLNADPTLGEINAFAACDDQGRPLMAVSDGLLEIEANMAAFRATDEVFHTRKLDAYLRMVSNNYRPGHAIPRVSAGFVDPAQAADGRKVARQHVLLEEQLAFVLGHELAHHYLGHTGCADGRGGSRARGDEILRAGVRVAGKTALNQVAETAADIAGTNNLLTAGSRRHGAKWNEEGAMLTFEFFSYMEPPTVRNVFISAFMTHAHPTFRRPVVQQAANQWRATGGTGFQIPAIPGFLGGG